MSRLLPLSLLLPLTLAAQPSPTTAKHKPTTTHRKAVPTKNTQPDVPPMPQVDKPTAVIDTTAGRLTCTLFPDKSPKSVENFVGLATGMKDWKDPKSGKQVHHVPLYNGTIFHRVIPNFMIQGGDPLGDGTSGAQRRIANECPDR